MSTKDVCVQGVVTALLVESIAEGDLALEPLAELSFEENHLQAQKTGGPAKST